MQKNKLVDQEITRNAQIRFFLIILLYRLNEREGYNSLKHVMSLNKKKRKKKSLKQIEFFNEHFGFTF